MLGVQAWRSWRNARGVALLAASALAAGIGAATAIYTVVNAVMLGPLPYRDSDRFVALFGAATNDPNHYSSLSYKDAQTYQERTQAFDAFGWFREAGKNLTFAGEPHHVQGVAVTAPFVRELGVDPVLGQWFHDTNEVVISTALWRRLGADPGIVGKPLTLDGRPYVVTGVMPPSFRLPVAGVTSAGIRTDVWLALEKEEAGAVYFAYARCKPGITFAAAEADVKRIASGIAADDPVGHPSYTGRLSDLRETVVREIRPTLLLLFAAAGLLFLITCANAAGLLLAHEVARARDTAMRVALGATRLQLTGHYFAECLPVSLLGAVGGLLLSLTITPAIVSMTADYLPRAEDVAVDWTVLVFALLAALAATTLASLAPVWQALRMAPIDALGDGARASASARSRRASQVLVVAEIALAFALLAVSAELVNHLRYLSRTSPGFDTAGVLTFGVSVPGTIARNDERRESFQRQLIDGLAAIPGIDQVAFASGLPLDGCCMGTNVYPEGRSVDVSESQRMSLTAISPAYFETMRIPVRRGRILTDADRREDLIPAVVSEAAARRYWGTNDPLNAYGRFLSATGARFQVIGVVGDVKNDGLANPTVPEVYIHSAVMNLESMHFVARVSRPVSDLVPEIRRTIRSIDPDQPIHAVATMEEIVRRSMTLERAASFLTAFFASAALLLAMLGVYGVIAYFVRQRTMEIGTRMALGATSRDVLALIVRNGLKMAALGMVTGALAAIAAAIYVGRVFEVENTGAAPILYSTSIVGAMALVASLVPAWRATKVSPMAAIRTEPWSMWQAARRRVREAIHELREPEGPPGVPLGTVISDFAGSLRGAASLAEAKARALEALRDRVGAQSITLLEKDPSGRYACSDWSVAGDGFLLRRLHFYPHPLAVAAADFEGWSRWARESRSDYDEEIERLRASGARMAVPLRTKNEVVGIVLLGPPNGHESYTSSEKETLSRAADVFALIIENARLSERALEQERLRRDLAVAAEVQRRLLPPHAPRNGAVAVSAYTLPARVVGGDYYDFIDHGGDRIGIAVADVSGKGIAAALLMSVVQASLRVIVAEGELPLAQLAAKMNGFLHQSTGANKYATFFYAELDRRGRRLRYVNAGHNPPYLVRCADSRAEIVELDVGGTVLGLFPEVDYQEAELGLRPGDLIVAFTDGVTEAHNAEGDEFGEERLQALLREHAGAAAEQVASKLAETMRLWIGGAEQHDDLTFVVLKVN
jgi:predicted permease